MNRILKCLTIFVVSAVFSSTVHTQWEQWGGPNGNFMLEHRDLAAAWPESGPKQIWQRALGDGYSAIAAHDGVLYTMYRSGENAESVIALDPKTGRTIWEHKNLARIWDGYNLQYGPGPHATPLIHGDRIYTIGVRGDVICLDRETGKLLWMRKIWEEFGGKPSNRGHGSSPAVYEDNLIVLGGGKGHCIVALDLEDGTVKWRSGDYRRAYATPIIIDVDGQDQIVAFVEKFVVGVDPKTGHILWEHPHPTRNNFNISTPVWGPGNLLFIASAYDHGGRVIRLSQKDGKTEVKELWFNRKMQIHHGTTIRLGAYIYGTHGSSGPAVLTTIKAETGEIVSRQRGFAKSNLIAVGKRILILDMDGKLAIAEPEGDSLRIRAEAYVLDRRSWTVPTLVGTTLFVRDQEKIMALDLSR